MPTPNAERADAARAALATYAKQERSGLPDDGALLATMAQDLITDLLHLLDTLGADRELMLRMARGNHQSECEEENAT